MYLDNLFEFCCNQIIENVKTPQDAQRVADELARRLRWAEMAEWETTIENRRESENMKARMKASEEEAYQKRRAKYESNRDNIILQSHLKPARQQGREATLTLEQWKETVSHFGGICAYCKEYEYTCLEHFIPTSLDGGTTAKNCVPACKSCNSKKNSTHPNELGNRFPTEVIDEIRSYLQSR